MGSVFVLGPYVDGVIEPEATAPAPVATGRQQIIFDTPATTPGGQVNLKLVPPANPSDVPPINIHAFHVPQPAVPVVSLRTPEWFQKSGYPTSFSPASSADPSTGKFAVKVAGVKPSLTPYHVQTLIEYPS